MCIYLHIYIPLCIVEHCMIMKRAIATLLTLKEDNAKQKKPAKTGLLQWLECWPATERSQVQFQSRARTLIAGTSPVGGVQEGAGRYFSLISISNSLSLSLLLCKKNNKIYLKRKSQMVTLEIEIALDSSRAV